MRPAGHRQIGVLYCPCITYDLSSYFLTVKLSPPSGSYRSYLCIRVIWTFLRAKDHHRFSGGIWSSHYSFTQLLPSEVGLATPLHYVFSRDFVTIVTIYKYSGPKMSDIASDEEDQGPNLGVSLPRYLPSHITQNMRV